MLNFAAFVLALQVAAASHAAEPTHARFDWFEYEGHEEGHSAGKSQYHNPVLQGFYPDPALTRSGKDYYLANSTFAYFPGIPIFHSRDLVNWTQVGNAIDRADQLDLTGIGVSDGIFAPSLSEHSGIWYIVDLCVGCGGNFLISAKAPEGPWSKPIFIRGLDGAIDPSLFFDLDGSAWLVYNALPPGKPLYDGHRAIWLQRFDIANGQTQGERKLLVNGGIHPEEKPIWIEGPHIFRSGLYYYLVAAEGGTAENHSEVVLRSTNLTGPYGAGPSNPILTQRDLPKERPAPITSTGHASFVRSANGDWWTVFLGTRPYHDDLYNSGRETFLLPVTWRHGWPNILAQGEAVPAVHERPKLPRDKAAAVPTSGSFKIRDDFLGDRLPPYWMMLRTPGTRWYWVHSGSLTLAPRSVSIGGRGNPSLLVRRQQHSDASATTVIRYRPGHDGARAGLVAFQNDTHWYFEGLERRANKLQIALEQRSGAGDPQDGQPAVAIPFGASEGSALYLKAVAHGGTYDFFYGYTPNHWQLLRRADATILSTKRAGGFVGAMFGLYAYDPTAKD